MSDADELARAQAFNRVVMRYLYSLIETTKARGAPDAATLIRACEHIIREGALESLGARVRYECPKCGAVSYNPNDARERYCVRCHEFAE